MAIRTHDSVTISNRAVLEYDEGTGAFAIKVDGVTIFNGGSGGRAIAVGDANTSLSALNSGKPHLVANVSADRTFTLPAVAAGLDFEFIATVGAADGHDWIISTGSDTNYFVGGIVHIDTDSDAAGDEIVVVSPDGNSNSKLQINLPQGGTRVRVICDGTLWTVSGQAVSVTAPAFADQ